MFRAREIVELLKRIEDLLKDIEWNTRKKAKPTGEYTAPAVSDEG